MNQGKHKNLWLELTVIVASVLALALLVYFVMIVSFQSGVSSTNVSMRLAGRIARTVFEDPEQEQIETVSRMIRYGAHLALFFVVGLVTAFVSMVIFRGYFRIVGIILAGLACYIFGLWVFCCQERSVICWLTIRNILSSM